jgi:hypothetical protein
VGFLEIPRNKTLPLLSLGLVQLSLEQAQLSLEQA